MADALGLIVEDKGGTRHPMTGKESLCRRQKMQFSDCHFFAAINMHF